MKTSLTCIMLVCLMAGLSGCQSYQANFNPPYQQKTDVVLKENDFRWLEKNVTGSYEYWALEFGFGGMLPLLDFGTAELPFGDSRLYSNALQDLYRNSKTYKAPGGALQMVNWSLDRYSWYIPLFFVAPTKKTAVFRADVIEFTK